jgi:hypothetical protein
MSTEVATEQLDQDFAEDTILLLKIDVNGDEQDEGIISTASNLFRNKKIRSILLVYNKPSQVQEADSTLLFHMFDVGGTCYCLHRAQHFIFRIQPRDIKLFHNTVVRRAEKPTHVYCSLASSTAGDPLLQSSHENAPVWTPNAIP